MRSDGRRCDEGPSPVRCARCHAEMSRRYKGLRTLAPPLAAFLWRTATWPVARAVLGVDAQARRAATLPALLNGAAAIIVPSAYVAAWHRDHGIDGARMQVMRQGVDLRQCPLRMASKTLRVGYLGQMKHHKGVDLLLDAWAMLRGDRPRRLALWGSATGEPAYAESLRVRLAALTGATWVGEVDGPDVWKALSELDIVVIPSRWPENSANVILEAQATGVAVVGASIGGIPETVTHGVNGLLFQPDSSADLARQLQRLLDQPELLQALRGRPLPFRPFTQELDEVEAVYEQVVRSAASVSE
jgi:glycosyltransferase involved in cell wall biosynthesis